MKPIKFEREVNPFRFWRLSPLWLSVTLIAVMLVGMMIYLYNPYERSLSKGEYEATVKSIETITSTQSELTLSIHSEKPQPVWRKVKTATDDAADLSEGSIVCYFESGEKRGRLC